MMHGRHRQRGRGGRGPGRGRADHLLEPALLCSLLHGATHGYGLAEELARFGLEDVPLRRIYRVLQGLEAAGWVTSGSGGVGHVGLGHYRDAGTASAGLCADVRWAGSAARLDGPPAREPVCHRSPPGGV